MKTKAAAISAAGLIAMGTALGGLYFSSAEPPAVGTEDPVCAATEQAMPEWQCGAVGVLRFTFWSNLQPAVQFCKWQAANPGEWARINTYTTTGTRSEPIVTWLGSALANTVQAYFYVGGTPFAIAPNTVPNSCGKGKLIAPPTNLQQVG